LTVFLDQPVRRPISLIDNPSRNLKRRILPNMSMVIISFCPAQKTGRQVNHPGQFSARTTPENWSIFNAQQQDVARWKEK